MAATAQLLQPVEQLAAAAAAAAMHPGVGGNQQQHHVTADRHRIAAAAAAWSSFLHQLMQALRLRAPDISVLVAVMTNLQRAAVAAEAAAASTEASAEQQQQQQYTQQQLRLLQCQVCCVLRGYARWLPEAVADGHADLAKLLLQGQVR
jgi:type IV secretory pathway TraG/TraD family ATPase VirD4